MNENKKARCINPFYYECKLDLVQIWLKQNKVIEFREGKNGIVVIGKEVVFTMDKEQFYKQFKEI